MDLKTYLSELSTGQRDAFAAKCKTSRGHLQNVMYGFKTCATDLAVSIERESGKAVRRWELRDDWHRHWPELIGAKGAPKVSTKEAA